jgi:hypothetical protein
VENKPAKAPAAQMSAPAAEPKPTQAEFPFATSNVLFGFHVNKPEDK